MESGGEKRRMREIGLFDFDGTLVEGDSFIRFGIFAVGKAKFYTSVVMAIPWLIGWKAGMMSSSRAKEKLFGFLFRGMTKREFEDKGELFVSEITKMLQPEIYQELIRLRDAGREVVIASASVEEWIRPWAKTQGVDCVIGTQVEVDGEGRLTGRFSTPNCLGKEKAMRVREYLRKKLLDGKLETLLGNEEDDLKDFEISAWGNLPDDKWMLEMADHPHQV